MAAGKPTSYCPAAFLINSTIFFIEKISLTIKIDIPIYLKKLYLGRIGEKMMPKSSFIEELENTRKASGLTQAELAQRSGVNRMTVGRVEAGFDPRLSTVQELARAMGMDLMLVPRDLRPEVERFVQSGGKLVSQPSGVSAPLSVVDLIELAPPAKTK